MQTYLFSGTTTLLLMLAVPAHAQTERSFIDIHLAGTSGGGTFSQPAGASGSINSEVNNGLGWGLRGAWSFSSRWQLYGEWGSSNAAIDASYVDARGVTVATEESDFDLDRMSVGIGYRWSIADSWSAYSRLTWDSVEYGDFDQFDIAGTGRVSIADKDSTGLGVTLGIYWSDTRWDIEGWSRYSAVGKLVQNGNAVSFEDSTGVGVRAMYHLTSAYSLGLGYEIQKIDTWSVVFRYRF